MVGRIVSDKELLGSLSPGSDSQSARYLASDNNYHNYLIRVSSKVLPPLFTTAITFFLNESKKVAVCVTLCGLWATLRSCLSESVTLCEL